MTTTIRHQWESHKDRIQQFEKTHSNAPIDHFALMEFLFSEVIEGFDTQSLNQTFSRVHLGTMDFLIKDDQGRELHTHLNPGYCMVNDMVQFANKELSTQQRVAYLTNVSQQLITNASYL